MERKIKDVMENNDVKTEYDMVIVLSPSERNEFGKFIEYEKSGVYLGGQTRMDAAVEICKKNMQARIIVVGGLKEGCKSMDDSYKTKGMKDYLEEKCGNDVHVERVNSLPCTKHNFISVLIKLTADGEDLNFKKIGILTNYYHLPRAWKFLSHALGEYKISGKPIFIPIAAESIVDQHEIYSGKKQEYLLRLEDEVRGIKMCELGEYKDGCLYRKGEYKRGKLEDFIFIIGKEGDRLLSEKDREFLRRGVI